MVRKFSIMLAGCTCWLSTSVSASSADWQFVTGARIGSTNAVVQVDVSSLRAQGSIIRYWVRFIEGGPEIADNPFSKYVKPLEGPSLYESNCSTGQSRIMQGKILWGYRSGLVPLYRPADWQYVEPDSIESAVHSFSCQMRPK